MRFGFRSPWTAAALALFVVVLRSRIVWAPTGDANVGAIYHVAAVWLHGGLPYVAAWEYKPLGAFAMWGAGLALLGSRPLADVVLGDLATLAIVFACAGIARRLAPQYGRASALFAALFAAMLSTENSGLDGDAELFVAAFTTLALLLALGPRSRAKPWLVGMCTAAAIQLKLTALPLVVAVALVVWLRGGRRRTGGLAIVTALTIAPFALGAALYAAYGKLAAFTDANLGATLRRASGLQPPLAAGYREILRQFYALAPALELAPLAWPARRRARPWLAWLWAASAALAIVGAGELYYRHFFMAAPPIAVLGGIGLARLGVLLRRARTVAAFALVLSFALHSYYEVVQSARYAVNRVVLRKSDWRLTHVERLAAVLKPLLARDGASLYLIQEDPYLYDSLGTVAPTPYAFSGLLLEPRLWPMLGFTGTVELQRVLDARPRILVAGKLEGAFDPLAVTLVENAEKRYRAVATVDASTIYELAP